MNYPLFLDSRDTIAAICTPPGNGGVAMIRLSGPHSIAIANQIFSKEIINLPSYRMTLGEFLDQQNKVVDKGLLVVMRAPHSYTGEDVVELFCHGGHLITKKVLNCALQRGARAAGPGEFTQRAFLNKKMDLAQAEAVQSLISAQNEYALKIAADQLEGYLSKKIENLKQRLIDQAAILEAWVDFPEEGIEFCTLDEIKLRLENIFNEIEQLINSYHEGQMLKEGFSLCLIGRPNVGKSSLLNQMLKKERAIVTPIAGTTRDLIEETILIHGMQYRLMDTAGIRQVEDLIEKEGIERALRASKSADLVLLVLDASSPLTDDDQDLIEQLKQQKVLVVWNKVDLGDMQQKAFDQEVKISAKNGFQIELLYQKINEIVLDQVHSQDQIYLTEMRHKEALLNARHHLQAVLDGLNAGTSPEWLSYDVKSSLKSLSQIIGFDITENILTSIFKNFCIGK